VLLHSTVEAERLSPSLSLSPPPSYLSLSLSLCFAAVVVAATTVLFRVEHPRDPSVFEMSVGRSVTLIVSKQYEIETYGLFYRLGHSLNRISILFRHYSPSGGCCNPLYVRANKSSY